MWCIGAEICWGLVDIRFLGVDFGIVRLLDCYDGFG